MRAAPDPLRAKWHEVEMAVRDSRFFRALAAELSPSPLRRLAQFVGAVGEDPDRAACRPLAGDLGARAPRLRSPSARDLGAPVARAA
jgi:hypothetical protein